MNAAEDRLSEMMDAATRALAPPVESILAEGERLGRRRRRRRRAAVATGTAAVVLLAGVGTAAGLRFARADRDDNVGAATVVHHASRAPTTPSAVTSAGPTPSFSSLVGAPTPSVTPPRGASLQLINSQAAVEILKQDGAAVWKFGSYDPTNTSPTLLLNVIVDDGGGSARISVAIGTVKYSGMPSADCKLQAQLLQKSGNNPVGGPQPKSCDVKNYPNGDTVMQQVFEQADIKFDEYQVTAYRADGVAVEIVAANGDGNVYPTEVTRALPPLTVAQWTAIALDRAWKLEVPAKLTEVTPAPPPSPTSGAGFGG